MKCHVSSWRRPLQMFIFCTGHNVGNIVDPRQPFSSANRGWQTCAAVQLETDSQPGRLRRRARLPDCIRLRGIGGWVISSPTVPDGFARAASLNLTLPLPTEPTPMAETPGAESAPETVEVDRAQRFLRRRRRGAGPSQGLSQHGRRHFRRMPLLRPPLRSGAKSRLGRPHSPSAPRRARRRAPSTPYRTPTGPHHETRFLLSERHTDLGRRGRRLGDRPGRPRPDAETGAGRRAARRGGRTGRRARAFRGARRCRPAAGHSRSGQGHLRRPQLQIPYRGNRPGRQRLSRAVHPLGQYPGRPWRTDDPAGQLDRLRL